MTNAEWAAVADYHGTDGQNVRLLTLIATHGDEYVAGLICDGYDAGLDLEGAIAALEAR